MFKFALKNMAVKRAQLILIAVSIILSAGVAVLAYNTAEQVSDGITSGAAYYSVIIGPEGSETQLAMNSMYFADEILGTIPYDVVEDLRSDVRVKSAIPFAMADSFNGYNLVGTTREYLDGKSLANGDWYDQDFEVVVGATVAKVNQLHVGDEIYTSHSAGDEHHTPFTVVGILEESGTSFDRIVFTSVESLWAVHEEEEHGEEHEEHEEHDHEEMNHMVCAVLVKTVNLGGAAQIKDEYDGMIYTDEDGDTFSLQAVIPMEAVRNVLKDADNTKYIVYLLAAVILVMNIIIIAVITLLNMTYSKKEIHLMRLIGIGMNKINRLYFIENGLTGLVSVLLAFGLSRLCLTLMSDYVLSMGVVLNYGKVYPVEALILVGVWIITVLPTFIATRRMAGKDGLDG